MEPVNGKEREDLAAAAENDPNEKTRIASIKARAILATQKPF